MRSRAKRPLSQPAAMPKPANRIPPPPGSGPAVATAVCDESGALLRRTPSGFFAIFRGTTVSVSRQYMLAEAREPDVRWVELLDQRGAGSSLRFTRKPRGGH